MAEVSTSWETAEAVAEIAIVDEYLEAFANDRTWDSAVALVRLIMDIERNKSYESEQVIC